MEKISVGGQAVIEGVMMKGPLLYSVAVRKASGEIRIRDFPHAESPATKRIARIPLVRGVVAMAGMLAIGYRALQYSADEAADDAEGAARPPGSAERAEPGGGGLAMAGAMAAALLLAVGLFFLLPLYATHALSGVFPGLSGSLAFNLADGAIRNQPWCRPCRSDASAANPRRLTILKILTRPAGSRLSPFLHDMGRLLV